MQLQARVLESFEQQSACQVYVTRACSPAQVYRPIPRRAVRVGYISTRRQQFAALPALSTSAATKQAGGGTSDLVCENHEHLLHALSSYSVPELRQYMQKHPDDVSLGFLQWLASREDELQGSAKLRLAVLAGQLLALREGLDPAGFDDVAEELQQQWQASAQFSDQQQNPALSQQQQQTPDQHQQESSLQHIHRATPAADAINFDLFPSTPSSLQQSLTLRDTNSGLAFNAFSDAGIVRQSEQQAHAQSTVQLIGRKQISAHDPPQVSGAAHRILEYLMGLATAEMRREVLPEAFESPESGVAEDKYDASSEGSDTETEQLSTTPLQLLQAVDLQLARIRNQSGTAAEDSNLLVPAGDSSVGKLHDALQQLRTDVLAQWDAA